MSRKRNQNSNCKAFCVTRKRNKRFSDVFRGYRKGKFTYNGFKSTCQRLIQDPDKHFFVKIVTGFQMFYILCFQLWCLSSFWICLSWWAHYVIWRHKKCLYDAHAATRSLSFQSVIFYVWSSSSKEKSTCAIRGLSSSSVTLLFLKNVFLTESKEKNHIFVTFVTEPTHSRIKLLKIFKKSS